MNNKSTFFSKVISYLLDANSLLMSANKFILLVSLVVGCKPDGLAQSTCLIIDSLYPGITKVDLHSTRIYCALDTCDQTYRFDLDKNGTEDMNFRLFGNVSTSNGTSVVMLLSSSDSCTFFGSLGKGYQVNSTNDTSRFTTPLVKILNYSDTLFADSCLTNSSKFTQKENPPTFHYISYVNEWISGTHIFGFKKIKNKRVYLGWVRLQIHSYVDAELKEYVIQTLPVGINESAGSSPPLVYPNPVVDSLVIKNTLCRKVEIYNSFGNIVLTEENRNHSPAFSMDVSRLQKGVYIVKIVEYGKGGYTTVKMMKQ